MRVAILAIGRLKQGPERELFEHYVARLEAAGRAVSLAPLRVVELPESRAADSGARKKDEAERLLRAAADADVRIALDGRGRPLDSEAIAAWLRGRRDGGCKSLALLLGGPDGHDGDLVAGADLKLSLGALTLPHGLARIVLAEQLYRSATIIAGHPYHRA